jgi:hypothetical protein
MYAHSSVGASAVPMTECLSVPAEGVVTLEGADGAFGPQQ